MILRIVAGEKEIGELGTHTLTLKEFGMKEYQPFLATEKWERVDIDLTEETPRGLIRQLVKSNHIVPHFDKENITMHIMYLLCEIAVDDAARLRSLYTRDMSAFKEALEEVSKKYGF